MTHNPLDDDDKEYQHRVSQRAYHLWKSEGELHGHDQEYWERAKELIGMEESAGSGQLPNPMTVPGNDPSRTTIVEESSIQENLGEFPGRVDQGDEQPYPTAAATHAAAEPPIATPGTAETAKVPGTGTDPSANPKAKAGPATTAATAPVPTAKAMPTAKVAAAPKLKPAAKPKK